MARLNDPPPPPAESIESLKRRFIRQNREIARVNSTQSQRIRNLESEISRLVAENISLREQVIAAQAETQRWKRANTTNSRDIIIDVKDRLERKLKEVSDLISEMDGLPEKISRRASRRRSALPVVVKSLSEEEYKNRIAMKEALAKERQDPALDGRLPSIQEDKLFPRRTLETAEMMALRDEAALQDSTESPDLGPPPVAHFEVPDPVKFEADTRKLSSGDDQDVVQLPSTLEKRRRRRTSALLQDMPRETEQSAQPPESPIGLLLKAGAKRKLDASELEEPIVKSSSPVADDFVFQRKQDAGSGKKPSRFTRPPGKETENTSAATTIASPRKVLEPRKILAPKSTNSPAKRKVSTSEKPISIKSDADSHPIQPSKPSTTRVVTRISIPPSSTIDPESKNGADTHPPQTPAPLPLPLPEDPLSPISTEPSVRATHKEAAILNSVEDVLNGSIGRGSRRARAAVSYAEPNLRDKMRRPGRELVGAVEGIEKKEKDNPTNSATHSRTTSLERARSGCETLDGPVVKQEKRDAGSDTRWRNLPVSTNDNGNGNGNGNEDPASPLRDKEKKDLAKDRLVIPSIKDAALPAHETSKHDRTDYGDELEKAVDRLSIFDPPSSSPVAKEEDDGNLVSNSKTATPSASAARRRVHSGTSGASLSRRHSMQPASSAPVNHATKSDSHSARAFSRPASAASLRAEASASRGTDATSTSGKELKRAASVASNIRSTPVSRTGDQAAATVQPESRAERLASRRKSMMV
ncbi:hypothetical protein PV10_01700 [Exophiala mesophila]|uniref:Shugoshin C-terminal domain-containing protein n=1 Tax=Exophiala mesophila TaxID=212818 RepID=A0A0D1YBN0_EXOME|nr:uncharacterized protein PV10_01700 [Exophiala mesophila]KIV98006.1 hypothetical protein PV10_01700 [Exophiala mesophila]